MSVCLNAEAPSPAIDIEENKLVTVFRYDGVTYLVDSDGANALRCADRSQTLIDMPEAQGHSTLPISQSALYTWQSAVASMVDSNELLPEWRVSTRAKDLCTLATVSEFLRDDDALTCATDALAQVLKDEVQHAHDAQLHSDSPGGTAGLRASQALTAIASLHSSLQTTVFSKVPLPLSFLVPVVPNEMLLALVQRHLSASRLDISRQLVPLAGKTCNAAELRSSKAECSLSLRELSPVLACLPPLKSLDLSRNRLIRSPERDFDGGLPALSSLISTHASSLESFTLAEEAQEPASGTFVLTTSQVCTPECAAVWQSLSKCSALSHLDLSYHTFHPSHAQHLLSLLCRLSSLVELDLSGSCTSFVGRNISPMLFSALRSVPHLTALSLADNSLYSPKSKGNPVLSTLQSMHKLQFLDISGNPCRFPELLATLAVVASMPSIRCLKADRMGAATHNRFTVEDSMTRLEQLCRDMNGCICPQIDTSGTAVATSVIDNPGKQGSITPGSVSAASEGLLPSAHLTSLSLNGFATTSAVAKLVLHFMFMKFVWEVDEVDSGVVRIAEPSPSGLNTWSPVDTLQNLQVLDLSGVSMGYAAEDRDVLATFVGSLSSLRELNLSDCLLPPSCLVRICEVLRKKIAEAAVVGITSLDWSCNQKFLGADVMGAVCGVWTLQRLVLQQCGVGAQQARDLGKHLPGKLLELTSLDLSRNLIRSEGVAGIAHGCSQLSNLVHLHCGVAVGGAADLQMARRTVGEHVNVEMSGDSLSEEEVMFSMGTK